MKQGATSPRRACPPAYGYSPSVFVRAPDLTAEVLYVAGGLYGNLPALRETERMATLEREQARLVFNGDFHWFDAEAGDDVANGCGCAYPESVPDAAVSYGHRIVDGPDFSIDDALGRSTPSSCIALAA